MRKIQTGTSKYTQVLAIDESEFNANHEYQIKWDRVGDGYVSTQGIKFQKGPVKENGINGIHHEDLIVIIIDRLQSFQKSEYSCRENAIAITKLEETLMWLRKRTTDREARGVEGTHKV